jgi:sortase (surface protein transpeptidase)
VGVTEQTFYRWKKEYGGMLSSDMKRLKQLEDKNVYGRIEIPRMEVKIPPGGKK